MGTNLNKDEIKIRIGLICIIVVALIICPIAFHKTKVSALPTGQEYVKTLGSGSLIVESSRKIRLWDGSGFPNTFTIDNGFFYNEYGSKVGTIKKKGEKIYIHSSNSMVQSAYGGKYKPFDGHYKGVRY